MIAVTVFVCHQWLILRLIVRSFVYYSPETTGQSPTLTRASTQKRQEPKVKANREVARAAKKHTVEFTAPRGSDDDEECRSSTLRGWRR